ncbi:MAG: DNA alkylation repair protein [Chlorobi bacterium]|nr:DNA alkylation repair protein [Chlorobiota bacterium]
MEHFLQSLDQVLLSHADKEKAPQMAKYMRNLFPFLGIQSPVRKKILSDLVKDHGLPPKESLEEIVTYCWEKPEREYQMIGMGIAGKYLRQLEPGDINLFTRMITLKSWWDTVDYIAATLVGRLFSMYPEIRDKEIPVWISSGNLWLQRSTIIFQLKYKDKTNTDLLEKNILALQPGKEFFINKAVGWALREYSKTDPLWVMHFTKTQPLSPLSYREALKWINRKK